MAAEAVPDPKQGQMSRPQMRAVLEHFGWYQRRLLLLCLFPLFMDGHRNMSVVLTFFSPEHRCRVPGLDNDTFAIQDEAHRMLVNLSIPMTSSDGVISYSKCDVYKFRDEGHANRTLYDVTEPCDSWVYDYTEFDRTIVTQFDLVCHDRGFRANYSMFNMLGLLVGSSLSGIICDRYGRKKVCVVSMTLSILVWITMTFPVGPPMLLVCRFLHAALSIAFFISNFILAWEFVGTSKRTLAGLLIQVVWVLGPLLMGGLSYVISDWRWLHIAGASTIVFIPAFWWFIDESPRWLMAKGRMGEAQKVILKIMEVSKMTSPAEDSQFGQLLKMEDIKMKRSAAAETGSTEQNTYTENMKENMYRDSISTRNNIYTDNMNREQSTHTGITDHRKTPDTMTDGMQQSDTVSMVEDERLEEECELPPESILNLRKYGNLIARTAIIFFNWATASMTYFGLSLNVSNLGGNVRANFLLSNLMELVGYSTAFALLDRLGRKRTHCAFMFLAGLACLGTIFSVMFGGPGLHWVTILLVMMGKLGISAAISILFIMTAELFPTVVRNSGLGFSSMAARVTSIVSPYLADMALHIAGNMGRVLPLIIFGALVLAAGLLALCLPETLNRQLPDTILEAAYFTKKGRKGAMHVPANSRPSL